LSFVSIVGGEQRWEDMMKMEEREKGFWIITMLLDPV
jgi:hypothetical protein